jgi:hypothetical protein
MQVLINNLKYFYLIPIRISIKDLIEDTFNDRLVLNTKIFPDSVIISRDLGMEGDLKQDDAIVLPIFLVLI